MKALELPKTDIASFLEEIKDMTEEKHLRLTGDVWEENAESRNLQDYAFCITDKVPWEMIQRKEWKMSIKISEPLDDFYDERHCESTLWNHFHDGYKFKFFISIADDALKEAIISALGVECYEIDDITIIEDQIKHLYQIHILRVNNSKIEHIKLCQEW